MNTHKMIQIKSIKNKLFYYFALTSKINARNFTHFYIIYNFQIYINITNMNFYHDFIQGFQAKTLQTKAPKSNIF